MPPALAVDQVPEPAAADGAAVTVRQLGTVKTTVETLRVGLDLDRGLMRSITGADLTWARIGTRPYLVLAHPDGVDYVLRKARLKYVKSNEYESIKAAAGINLLTDEGDSWAAHRGALNPAFAKRRLNDLFDLMVDPIEKAADRLVEQGDRCEIDIHDEMVYLTVQVVAKALFSRDLADLVGLMNDLVTKGMQVGESLLRFSLVGALPASAWRLLSRVAFSRIPVPPPFAIIQEVVQGLDQAVNRVVDDRIANPTDTPDLLNRILQADNGSWPRQRVRDEALTFMAAGHETTANSLSWFWYLMAINPDARQRMLGEVDSVLDGRRVDLDALDQLPWTTACIMEAQRYYSAVPVIFRTAIEDDVVLGHRVPKGTTVLIPIHNIHHDERFWPDPDQFDPHRFLPGAPRHHRSAYLPFGGGRRVCIGQSFALMEMVAAAAALSQRFVFDLVPGHPIAASQSLTLRPTHGVRVIAKRRNPLGGTDTNEVKAEATQCPVHSMEETQ